MGSSHSGVKPKTYEIGIDCFSSKYAALRNESIDWLTRNQDNVSDYVVSVS